MSCSIATQYQRFETEGNLIYDKESMQHIVNPENIAYFIHPRTQKRCNVLKQPYKLQCGLCHSHRTYIYELDNNQFAYYCECLQNGGQWVFSSKYVF